MARKKKLNPKIWRKVRKRVLKRDRYKCQWCGKRSKGNHVHHIKKKSKYPSLMYSMSNLITLCPKHHRQTYGKEERFVKSFGKGAKPPKYVAKKKKRKYRKVVRRTQKIRVKVKKQRKKKYKVVVKR